MKNNLPERKRNRLKEYDYSSCGVYFITICARKRDNYFWSNAAFDSLKIVGAISDRPPIVHNPQDVGVNSQPQENSKTISHTVGAISDRPPIVYNPQDVVLSECGKVVDEAINKITSIKIVGAISDRPFSRKKQPPWCNAPRGFCFIRPN
jgi:hypothetical protein